MKHLTLLLCTLALLAGCQARAPIVAAVDEAPAMNLPTRMPTVALPATAATAETESAEVETAVTATAVLSPTQPAALPPTFTPAASRLPTRTPLPAPTAASDEAAAVPTAPPTAVPTLPPPTAAPAPVDRSCPDPVPLKPEYNRYYLSGQVWPAPNPAVAETHFWLAKPLPGGGRFLINASFPYGWDGGGRLLLHNGVDAAEPLGTPVLAAADGVVVVAQADMNAWYGWRCDWYGHLVVVEHDARWFGQPVYTLYGHVLNISVEVGQRVQQGEPVAEVGFGGAATAAHLHFEVRLGSNEFSSTRNPMLWIHPGETRGVIAGRLLDPEGRPWQGVTIHLLDENGDIAATTWSYLDDPLHYINPDEGLAENFVFSDVVPGDYTAYVELQDVIYRQPVTVTAGEVALLEVRTEPYRAPEP